MINQADILEEWHKSITEEKTLLVKKFFSSACNGRRFLLGKNELSSYLINNIEISAIVDNYSIPGTEWLGKKVIHGSQAPKDAIIINCSVSVMPYSAQRMLLELDVEGVISYSDLYKINPSLAPLPVFVSDARNDLSINLDKWLAIENSLTDFESKTILSDLLKFRITGDVNFMKSYTVKPEKQYFEDFILIDKNEVFVDAGGFDGDTTEIFCKKYPEYNKIYFFEPSRLSIEKAKIRLQHYKNITFITQGVSDETGFLRFDPNQGPSSLITESGSSHIEITTIDSTIDSKITFIKMDIEGWELKALKGAERHILEDNPKLAIAVYHNISDFWKTYEYIANLSANYKVFLRHYTEGWTETIMYFVPIN